MEVSNHACERYCERFMGMTDRKEIKNFLNSESEDQVRLKILQFYTRSYCIYTGKILDTDPVRNFHLVDDVILVLDEQVTSVITLYKIDYGFPSATNLKVVNDLAELIQELKARLDTANMEAMQELYLKETRLLQIDAQIQATTAQLELLSSQKYALTEDIKGVQTAPNLLRQEIRSSAIKLVCSWEYKRDFAKDSRIRA